MHLKNDSSEINSDKVLFLKLIFKLNAKILVGNSKVFSKVAKQPFLAKILVKVIMCEMVSVFRLSNKIIFQKN